MGLWLVQSLREIGRNGNFEINARLPIFPLWESSKGELGNVDPSSLPISSDLIARLNAWAARFDQTLNLDDPMNSGFESDEMEEEFAEAGRSLCLALQKELGSAYTVFYGQEISWS